MSLNIHGEKMPEQEQVFFVKVREPDEVKKNLLESLRDIVESMHRFEKFKEIRQEKLKNITKLREDVKELIKLHSNLKAALPESKLRVSLRPFKKKKQKVKKKKKTTKKEAKKIIKQLEKEERPREQKPISELEKLESELSAIEGRLSTLK